MIESLFLIEWTKNKNNRDVQSPDSKKTTKKTEKLLDSPNEKPRIKFSYPQENTKLHAATVLNQIINSHKDEMDTINELYSQLDVEFNKVVLEHKALKKGVKTTKSSTKSSKASSDCVKPSASNFKSASESNHSSQKPHQIDDDIDWEQYIFGENQNNTHKLQKSPLTLKFDTQTPYEPLINAIQKDLRVQIINEYAIYSVFIPKNGIICLIFDKEDNPYDYHKEFEESLNVFVFPKILSFMVSVNSELATALISIFIDIRGKSLLLLEDSKYHVEEVQLQEQLDNQEKIAKLFLYGIDNAGKSSFMRYLKTDGKFDHNYFPPTKKFVIHKIVIEKNIKLIFWEMPGQSNFRRVWLRGVQDSNLLIFMLDGADKERYMEAKGAFWSMITRPEVRDVPVLFIVNKIDLMENEQDLKNIEKDFSLFDLKDRKWKIIFTSCVNKKGIKDVLSWIAQIVEECSLCEVKKDV
jgi:small GTP-binding protein